MKEAKGEYSVVATKGGKVIGQFHTPDKREIPDVIAVFKDDYKGAVISVEDPSGKIIKVIKEELLKEAKYRAEVAGVGENTWSTNAMEYNSEDEAKDWLKKLSSRWFGYDLSRVVPTSTPRGQKVDLEKDDIFQNFRRR